MVLTGYDAATGALQFDAQSGSVIGTFRAVMCLQKTGLFRKVDYTGYTYEDGVRPQPERILLGGGSRMNIVVTERDKSCSGWWPVWR